MKTLCKFSMHRQNGVSLAVTLLMLVAVLLLSTSVANIAMQTEKASRNDRDRQVAFQAAEAALMDAELDIEGAPNSGLSRSSLFAEDKVEGFVQGCGAGIDNPYLGLCLGGGAEPAWLAVDFSKEADDVRSVPYGRFTGMAFQTGEGTLPAKPPRYIIEVLPYTQAGQGAGQSDMTFFYRVTAAGFGMRPASIVVLQSYYRKGDR